MATIQASDVLPVRSRISWSAVLAGAFVALALYLVLMLGGAALGVTMAAKTNVSDRALGVGAGLWATVSLLLSLFVGGMVASRCSVGENKTEAAIYGVVVWGSFFFLLALLTAGTVNTGINALLGVSNAVDPSARLNDQDFERFGFTKDQITAARERARGQTDRGDADASTAERMRDAAGDPRTRATAWWAFIGMALSIAAAVGGSVLGAGPNLVITSFRIRAAAPVTEAAPRETVVR